jgi:hypothetical protein
VLVCVLGGGLLPESVICCSNEGMSLRVCCGSPADSLGDENAGDDKDG